MDMNRIGICIAGTIMALCLALGVLIGVGRERHGLDGEAEAIRLFSALGFPATPISTDCSGDRAPLEGVCSCLDDVPGGYCYHIDCSDTSPIPFVDADYLILAVR